MLDTSDIYEIINHSIQCIRSLLNMHSRLSFYLQLTVILNRVVMFLPTPLLAVHSYVPVFSSFVGPINSNLSPVSSVPGTAWNFQEIMGAGFPDALQKITTESVSLTVRSTGVITNLGGTAEWTMLVVFLRRYGIVNNYSPRCRWIAVDIYRAASAK